jgi:chromosome partitioning protein
MPSIIVITNEKGGVGKTTSAANLAAAYAAMGKRILTIDMDPQRNLTDLMGISQEQARNHSVADTILERKAIDPCVVPTKTEGIDLLPATPKLREVVRIFGASFEQDKLLKKPLDTHLLNQYDIIIIDTHGAQNCLLTSSLSVAHYYLIPLFPESDAARGVFDVIEYAERVRQATNHTLTLLGLMITGYDKRVAVHNRVSEAIKEYGRKARIRVFSTVIPFSSRVKTAAEQQLLLGNLREDAPITMAYQALAGEIMPLLKGRRIGRVSTLKLDEMAAAVDAIEAMDISLE